MTLRVVPGDGPDLVGATRRLARGYAQTWVAADGQLEDHDVQMLARLPEPYVPPDGASLLALPDGDPVGCVFLRRHVQQVDAVEMKHLFVLDGWRRRGIGKALVVAAVTQAQQMGGAVLLLDVDESRRAAIRLYEAFGFLPTEPFNEGWPGARWYALPLSA